ncbi:YceD family protein [Oceanicola sp. S124]|uniref:YceD family protein n=1 Tax=Oceanicola sp. S124 TaxID=1042378 RepID=UPI0002558191|nr:DUF177 domain-containing protein [Oceanicola sp. S124]
MSAPSPTALAVASLPKSHPTAFSIAPEAAETAALAEALDLLALRKVSFRGELKAAGKNDWLLTGRLGATVVQPCSVTLAPVTTRIEENVTRRFMPVLPEAQTEEDEIEMPEDESLEQLGSHIDPAEVMAEALALALPLYPRAEGGRDGSLRHHRAGPQGNDRRGRPSDGESGRPAGRPPQGWRRRARQGVAPDRRSGAVRAPTPPDKD